MILGRSLDLWQNLIKAVAALVIAGAVFANPAISVDTLTSLVGVVIGVAFAILALVANKAITGSFIRRVE
jgi:uncharacterized membrane protein HdeD (DUF308 family)